MTTYFPFTPSTVAPPTFQPTLDGTVYTCSVTWSLFGQRYQLNCFDGSGNPIFYSVSIVNTLSGVNIDTLSWSAASLSVMVTTVVPHNYPIGQTLSLTVENANPTKYNGTYLMLSTGPNTLVYPLANDPGSFLSGGSVSYFINLVAGYFTSTLIFRNGQFEVSP